MSPEMTDWIDEARNADPAAVAALLGISLKKSGRDLVASCPVCGGRTKNEFVCTPGNAEPNKRWLCRKSGEAGTPVQMWRHVTGDSFIAAVKGITGKDPPDRREVRVIDPEYERERRERAREKEREQTAQAKREREKKMESARDIFDQAKPIRGTHADAYLRARCLVLMPGQDIDLRFVSDLPYHGYASDQANEVSLLGRFPAMLAAIRNGEGEMIGVHRTYLDPSKPRKLAPPGDQTRNRAKKISGNAKGGLIRLGEITDLVAIGEGIETTLAFGSLEVCPAEASLAAAVSLVNMSGGSAGSVAHPSRPGARIPSGEPDMANPGMELPPQVSSIILLGDGDSDPPSTRGHLICALRRAKRAGLDADICMADEGKDFAVMLEEIMGRGAL